MDKAASGAEVIDTKRGFPVYDRNPSVITPAAIGAKAKPIRVQNGSKVMIVGADTGEVLGEGHTGFFEFQEVDEAKFVKLYLDGMKQTTKLTATGLKVFEIVYHQMRANPQTDRLELNFYLAKKHGLDLSVQSFRRGLRELLEHEFLYRSPFADAYFINVNFVFNGSRITLAKSYYIKGSKPPSAQLTLGLDETKP